MNDFDHSLQTCDFRSVEAEHQDDYGFPQKIIARISGRNGRPSTWRRDGEYVDPDAARKWVVEGDPNDIVTNAEDGWWGDFDIATNADNAAAYHNLLLFHSSRFGRMPKRDEKELVPCVGCGELNANSVLRGSSVVSGSVLCVFCGLEIRSLE